MTTNEQATWVFTDRDGTDWTVTETREHRLLKPDENPHTTVVGEVRWIIDGFVVSQPLYAHPVRAQWHREVVKEKFQELLDQRL